MIDTDKDCAETTIAEPPGGGRQREGRLLERLCEDERARVVAAGTVTDFRNGEYLVTQGAGSDGIYVILRGLVESVCEEVPGRELTLAYWSSGEFVGAPNILSDRPHIWSSKAVGTVRTLWLPEETLRELIEKSPKFAIALIHCLSFKAECYAKLAQTLATHSIESRLAEVLLSYGQDYGDRQADSLVVGRVRQRDLAKMVGATRQSVSLALKKMQAQQLIEIKPTSIVVKRLDSLRRLIEQ
jgi:CRP-like cAMP-binding protein